MTDLTGRYLCSQQTLNKADSYLKSLANKRVEPGAKLKAVLSEAKINNFNEIDAKQLIALLMNTRSPQIFAESDTWLNGFDWNSEETAILGDMVFSTTGTHAFNNGAHNKHSDHQPPLEANFLFVASALLRNDHGTKTADMAEVLSNKDLDEDAFYKLYERRLLPGLLIQNELAKKDNKSLVINIPGLGCGQFAGSYETKVRAALPRVLKRIFETHAAKLDRVHTVNYDPFAPLIKDEFTTDNLAHSQIRLMARPLCKLPEGAQGSVASQLEFPKDGTDYTGCRLLKIVAWDHFSFPGNDLWDNSRSTDDGVSFASSDVIRALFALGQFESKSPVVSTEYSNQTGIVYAINPKTNKTLSYRELANTYPSKVTAEMIDIVSFQGLELEPEEINHKFEEKKLEIKNKFLQKLSNLDAELQKLTTKDQYASVYSRLESIQETFFENLNPKLTGEQLKQRIGTFREAYKRHIEAADSIMGHGWLYRIAEVLIKAIVGLFAGIGMVLGSVICQGLANAEHRKKFANTFFRLEQTEESKLLAQYEQDLLGDDEGNEGLLCLQNLTIA